MATRARLVGSLRERVDRAEAERLLREERARAAERTRIAREMHDVLAHRISLLSLHAGALEFRPDASPEEIAEAAGVIRRSAQAALQELREVVGVLREDHRGTEPPQPTLVNVRLYPLNAQANKGGLLQAQVVDNNSGHGSFTVPYLGDLLQGESTRVDAGYPSFGIVHQQVLGAAPRTVSGRRGVANAHGVRGVNAQCEYVLTGPGSGTGVCQFSDGAYYQMHFGG